MLLTLVLTAALGLLNPTVHDNFLYHHAVKVRPGDGPIKLLQRYDLGHHPCDLASFYTLNNLAKGDVLYTGKKYKLPVLIYKYNGTSIRSTINDDDYQKAVRIQRYNEWLKANGLRKTHYKDSKILWVPYHELHCEGQPSKTAKTTRPSTTKGRSFPILGKTNSVVTAKSQALKGKVFYLMAGHGGPDPGAVGHRGRHTLCEDEYAYDVTLRLFKLLIEHGAEAYMIIEDRNDGIRDEEILDCDHDETCHGASIPLSQRLRLKQRVDHVNQLYYHHRKKGIKDQTCLSIHVDSRSVNHRQDVFFCHYPESKISKKLAAKLQSTFAKKYKKYRHGGGYLGRVSARGDLYVLKNTVPKAILIELANIQNKSDHRRIVRPSNRQALAKWMLEGIMSD